MKVKHIFYVVFAMGFLTVLGFLIYNITTCEKYRTMRTIGIFPLGIGKKQKKSITDPRHHKYSGHRYLRHRRRYNFLGQRNSGQRE